MESQPGREEVLFHEAMQLATSEERAAFLAKACAADSGLRKRMETLIQAAHEAGDFLEHLPAALADGSQGPLIAPAEFQSPKSTMVAFAPVAEKLGDRIGYYKLLERIGEGGWGAVYMAEQTESLRRRVALKIIKLGMDTKQVVARFEAERQALALMDHPHIAKVFDAGATHTGRPYFVMELVKGIRITDYCDQHNLGTRERLDLFRQVCYAVQHAHQKGIIHRDLKPSNILVTLNDGVPAPKVIDFGIAKATQRPLTDKTLFTTFQQPIGTPAYMSPEQAAMSGQDIDTRSDIYALGVLLYELLTGRVPFEQQKLLAVGFDEMRRVIREQEPTRPSTRLNLLSAADLDAVAKHRGADPPRLIHLIRGDLDWIVMKCLEKDRQRRYETATGLAHDVERHLRHEPVTAGAPGAIYRTRKFVRRHFYGFATAAAITVLLVGAASISAWQAARATRAEQQARIVRTFLEDMLESVTPNQAKGRDTTLMREMMDRAVARMDRELKDQPEVQADLRVTIGRAQVELGEYAKGEAMLRQARDIYRRLGNPKNPHIPISLLILADMLKNQGRTNEAADFAFEARQLTERE